MCCVVISFLCLANSDCSGLPPAWDVDIWSGDSGQEAIVRCVTPEDHTKPCEKWDIMPCGNTGFDKMICIDLDTFIERQKEIIDKCEKWEKD